MINVIDDRYGLHREIIIKKSRVRDIFTPNSPIQTINFFSGRHEQVTQIIECLNTQGQHILLYGDRGVGKSSLALITCFMLSGTITEELYIKRCDSQDTFQSIVRNMLTHMHIDVETKEYELEKKFGLNKGIKIGTTKKRTVKGNADNLLSPSWVAECIQSHNGILLIDEFDVIPDTEKQKIAELIKLLSDCGSRLTIFIVGIAETAAALTGGHPSVNRCLKEIKLGRMSKDELGEIIEKGEQYCNISFDLGVKRKIISLSSGYAYYTHLLALKAAEETIANERTMVTKDDLRNAMKRAANDAEGSLKTTYDNATRSSRKQEFKNIVIAAALCGDEEFTASELRNKYASYTGQQISQNELNNYFGKLISSGDKCILKRLGTGVYKFTDPRMASYVRIANNLTQK